MESTGIWMVREVAEPIGLRLQRHFGGTLYRPWQNDQPHKLQFKTAFPTHSHWILLMTTGIAVRFLDGLVQDKHTDPAVVVLDEGCHYAISMLSGHEGGANRLAFDIANLTGAAPVITTATESLKPLVAGIGCRRGVSAQQIEAAVLTALGQRTINELRQVATIDLKAAEPGLNDFCNRHHLPMRVITQEIVASRSWVTKPSSWVKQNIGTDGVCEPCALIASPRGRLLVPKTTLNGVAVAIVEDIRGWDQ